MKRHFWIAISVVTAVALAVLLLQLPRTPLTNWDEGIYAEVTRSMHAGGSWMFPDYHGHVFLQKPPLTFWLMNAAFSVFGVTEFAVRFWSALAGVATAILITIWTWQAAAVTSSATLLEKEGPKRMRLAILAGLLFVTGRFLFFHAFRTGDIDGELVFFTTASLYCYWRSWKDQRWFWGVAIMTGLAVMTKSFIGLLPQLVQDVDLIVSGRIKTLEWRRVWQGLGILLLIIAPWHIAAAITQGPELWQQVVNFNLIERSSTMIASPNVHWYWYLVVLRDFFWPASALLVWAMAVTFGRKRNEHYPDRFFALWIIVTLIIFSLAKTKYDHYIQPLYPAVAMLIALAFRDGLQELPRRWRWLLFETSGVWLFVNASTHLAHEGFLWKLTPYGWLSAGWLDELWKRWLIAALAMSVIVAFARLIKKENTPKIVGGIITIYIVVLSLGWQFSYLKHLPSTSGAKELAAYMHQQNIVTVDMVNVSHVSEPALYFYLHRDSITTTEVSDTIPTHDLVLTRKSFVANVKGYTPRTARGDLVLLEKQ